MEQNIEHYDKEKSLNVPVPVLKDEEIDLSNPSMRMNRPEKDGIRSSLGAQSKLASIVELCKKRGFMFQNSEIYGGLAAAYDMGPLGAQLARNIRDIFMREVVQKRPNVVLIDGSIISHPRVWEASGHVDKFNDPLVQDTVTKRRFRADHLIEELLGLDTTNMSIEKMNEIIEENGLKSPDGNELGEVRSFNLMVEASLGATDESKQGVYLRGETCQNIFIAFEQLTNSMRLAPPFGVVQMGKVFRNEVTTKQFIIRTREFEQLEFEYFVKPEDATAAFDYWGKEFQRILIEHIGIEPGNLRLRDLTDEEKAHYAVRASDIECRTSGDNWLEISPLNHRGDWDLTRHSEYSGKRLGVLDSHTNERYVPFVIETSFGLQRLMYCVLDAGLVEEQIPGKDETRTVLKLHPEVAPVKLAILPLSNKPALKEVAQEIYARLAELTVVDYDEKGSIGKRYRRQDEIGTLLCITVDFDSVEDRAVTIRDRDTMEQERVPIDKVEDYARKRLGRRVL